MRQGSEASTRSVAAFGLGFALRTKRGRIYFVDFSLTSTYTVRDDSDTLTTIWCALDELRSGTTILTKDQLWQVLVGLGCGMDKSKDPVIETLRQMYIKVTNGTDIGAKCTRAPVIVVIYDDYTTKPTDIGDLFLRLSLVSQRLIRPGGNVSLTGMNKVLPIAWTMRGPFPESVFDTDVCSWADEQKLMLAKRATGPFPQMLWYATPDQISIHDRANVLLGAYLSPGTRVTNNALIAAGAGTLGPGTIEGQLGTGVVLGSGCSIAPGVWLAKDTSVLLRPLFGTATTIKAHQLAAYDNLVITGGNQIEAREKEA